MKLTVTFDPEDGTGPLTKQRIIYGPYFTTPNGLWYNLVKAMKEIIHTWRWTRAGKPSWEEKEKRVAWKTEAREWTGPIDEMIQSTSQKATSDSVTTESGPDPIG